MAGSPGARLRMLAAPLLPDGAGPTDAALLAELGKVIGLADAIQLHDLLKTAARGAEVAATDVAECARDELLTTRQALLDAIAEPFVSDNPDGFLRWPSLNPASGLDGLTAPQRLERFYIRLQQEIQVRVQALRQRIRKALTPVFPGLAELDAWLEQALAPRVEKGLAVIPRQLARRCEHCLSATGDADDRDDDWRQNLRALTCSLLVAEMDVRLEPVYGLVEALEDNLGTDRC